MYRKRLVAACVGLGIKSVRHPYADAVSAYLHISHILSPFQSMTRLFGQAGQQITASTWWVLSGYLLLLTWEQALRIPTVQF